MSLLLSTLFEKLLLLNVYSCPVGTAPFAREEGLVVGVSQLGMTRGSSGTSEASLARKRSEFCLVSNVEGVWLEKDISREDVLGRDIYWGGFSKLVLAHHA